MQQHMHSVSINGATVATQSWAQGQYLTTSALTSLTVTGTSTLKAMNIDNGTGNTFTITQYSSA